ncbi:hypothetical protein [Halorientalis pallida]|uniref:Uncharacterized protein n=1 Tax=Halorientalis pallida TaxID=2479928 RepID=A0A498L4C1_9EURY|nr:hypothetical protein [Halorientalis pallida]RXK51102.1 hypothetical protein EAF64_00165 [Halorientalis pallida]
MVSSCGRRQFLGLGAGAVAAALGGCFGLGGGDYPGYADWIPPSDEGLLVGYIDFRVTRDSPRADRLLPLLLPSRDGGEAAEFVPELSGLDGIDDPLLGWPLQVGGRLIAGAAIGIAAGGLGYLVDPEKPEEIVDELFVADGVAVGVGEIDESEADESLREGTDDLIGRMPFEPSGDYRGFTIYEPTVDDFDGVTALGESSVVVANTREELEAAVDAQRGDGSLAVDEDGTFEWLVDEGGRGDLVAGWNGSVDPSEYMFGDTDGVIANDLLTDRDHVLGAVDFAPDEDEITAELAVQDAGLDGSGRDRLQSELGTSSGDTSFTGGERRLSATGTYTSRVLDVDFSQPSKTPATPETEVPSGDPPPEVAEAVPEDAVEFSYDGDRKVKVGLTADMAVDKVTMRALESGWEGSTTTPQEGLYFYVYIDPEGDEVAVTATVDGTTGTIAREKFP